MRITREVAANEVYLNEQARWLWPQVPAHVWASEIAKAAVWIVGVVLILTFLLVLAPESRADSQNVSHIARYLSTSSVLPLAVGVPKELATDLLLAQASTWGDVWQVGSLQASETAVLKAIGLYVWPGGPTMITDTCCDLVWIQANIAIDVTLSSGFEQTSLNFGEVPVSTPEPGMFTLLAFSLALLVATVALLRSYKEIQP